MYCPRCGASYEPGDRFCTSCGATLKRFDEEPAKAPEEGRLRGLIGTTTRARLLTAGTAIAIAIAIAAFIALPAGNSGVAEDAYTLGADNTCVLEKQRIGALEVAAQRPGGIEQLGQGLVLIVAEWRATLTSSPPPRAHQRPVAALDSALLGVEIKAGTLARVAQTSDKERIIATAAQVDSATRQVERAIRALGLQHCAAVTIGLRRSAATP